MLEADCKTKKKKLKKAEEDLEVVHGRIETLVPPPPYPLSPHMHLRRILLAVPNYKLGRRIQPAGSIPQRKHPSRPEFWFC